MKNLPRNKNNIQADRSVKRIYKLVHLFTAIKLNPRQQVINHLSLEIDSTTDPVVKGWLIKFKEILEALKAGDPKS